MFPQGLGAGAGVCGQGHAVLPSIHCMPSVPLRSWTPSFPALICAFTGVFSSCLKPDISFACQQWSSPLSLSLLGDCRKRRSRHQELEKSSEVWKRKSLPLLFFPSLQWKQLWGVNYFVQVRVPVRFRTTTCLHLKASRDQRKQEKKKIMCTDKKNKTTTHNNPKPK